MPFLRLPLQRRIIDPDPSGPIRTIRRAAVNVEAWTAGGWFTPIRNCVIDTGASYSMISVAAARRLNLTIPAVTSQAPIASAAGRRLATIRDGELRIRFPQIPGRSFRLYCVFVEELPADTPLLFGRNDFIDTFRLTFDGRFSLGAPAGHVLLEFD